MQASMEVRVGGYMHASLKLKTVVLFCVTRVMEEKGRKLLQLIWARERIFFTSLQNCVTNLHGLGNLPFTDFLCSKSPKPKEIISLTSVVLYPVHTL